MAARVVQRHNLALSSQFRGRRDMELLPRL
jgi:hypothetical protein